MDECAFAGAVDVSGAHEKFPLLDFGVQNVPHSELTQRAPKARPPRDTRVRPIMHPQPMLVGSLTSARV
jgi:hypothetical protein